MVRVDPFQPPVLPRPERPGLGPVESFIVLTLQYAYGVDLELVDATGGPVRTSSALSGPWAGTPRPVDDRARVVPSDFAEHLVTGVAGERVSPSFHRRRFVFTASQDLGPTIDLTLDTSVPGYAATESLVTAARLVDELPQRQVALKRRAETFGMIEVRLNPLECLTDTFIGALTSSGAPRVQLTELETGQRSTVDLPGIERGVARVEGIPTGSYSAVFEAPGQLMRFPAVGEPQRVLHVGVHVAELDVPVAMLGSLELDLCTPDGTLVGGPILLSLTQLEAGTGREGESGVLFLRSRPYTVALLPAGSYRIGFLAPVGIAEPTVIVLPSATTELACTL